MTTTIALLDANVLYPAPERDLLLQMSFVGLFQARWTEAINDEWKRNLLAAPLNSANELSESKRS